MKKYLMIALAMFALAAVPAEAAERTTVDVAALVLDCPTCPVLDAIAATVCQEWMSMQPGDADYVSWAGWCCALSRGVNWRACEAAGGGEQFAMRASPLGKRRAA